MRNLTISKVGTPIKKAIADNFYQSGLVKSEYFDSKPKVEFKYLKLTTESKNLVVFSFLSKQLDKKADEELIIEVIPEEGDKLSIKTGNYCGLIFHNKTKIEIKPRLGNVLLKRMLNFANNVFIDDLEVIEASKDAKNADNIQKMILAYMFILSLEKLSLIGLPQTYTSISYHDYKLKGRIDLNKFIQKDIPFMGKISANARERVIIPEIANVLLKAIQIIQKNYRSAVNSRLFRIKSELKSVANKRFVDNAMIEKALNHKSLNNPMYTPYKKVLEYASLIINYYNIGEAKNSKAKQETTGFLFNIAELWEIYLRGLLRVNLTDYNISNTETVNNVYKGKFYGRKIKPDIVIERDKKIAVFDAKCKKMNYMGVNNNGLGDLDREDFFQIHTYMSYYSQKNLIAGGLLYPLEKEFEKKHCYADNWIGGSAKFIVDGVYVSEKVINEENKANIVVSEKAFIKRIKDIFEPQ